MCGIFGYIGNYDVKETIIKGLHRLEHRGYDAAGIGVVLNPQLLRPDFESHVVIGTVSDLKEAVQQKPWDSTYVGIGHVRWPTHGKNTVANAHPHFDCGHDVMLVHNGIIENHSPLKQMLIGAGHVFSSETDTEVIAHLIEHESHADIKPFDALKNALLQIRGTYAIAVCFARDQDAIYVARMGSPLVISQEGDECFIASEPYAFVDFANPTNHVAVLQDGIIARVSPDEIEYRSLYVDTPIDIPFVEMSIPKQTTSLKEHSHRMHEEIYQQPEVCRQLTGSSFSKNGRSMSIPTIADAFTSFTRVPSSQNKMVTTPYKQAVIIGCGTAFHAGLIGKRYIELLAGLQTNVFRASEFQAGPFNVSDETLVIAISQSGETRDTLTALKQAKDVGAPCTIAILNNMFTSLERETNYSLSMRAGVEVGVAATKTFTAQCISLLLLALTAGEKTLTTSGEIETWRDRLSQLPQLVQKCIEQCDPYMKEMVREIVDEMHHTIFIGRDMQFHIAQEGALKLKEIAYIPSDAQPSGELKHGPLALIDEHCLSVAIIPYETETVDCISRFEQESNALAEIRARNGKTLVITTSDAPEIESDWIVRVPQCNSFLLPLLTIIPLQLLAYHWAFALGHNPDKPRHLAKSVTVG